jgi:hypothetical protein
MIFEPLMYVSLIFLWAFFIFSFVFFCIESDDPRGKPAGFSCRFFITLKDI